MPAEAKQLSTPCTQLPIIAKTAATVELIVPHLTRIETKQDTILEKIGVLEGRVTVAEDNTFKPNNTFAGGLITAGGVIGVAIGATCKPFLKPIAAVVMSVIK